MFKEEVLFLKNQFNLDDLFQNSDTALIAGCDEVGRGCLAGPVVACCLLFKKNIPLDILNQIDDSKKLSIKKREYLFLEIKKYAYFEICEISTETIDNINILQASLLAMKNAFLELNKKISPLGILVDGNKSFITNTPTKAIINGDSKSLTIGAASIIAKVHRDSLMRELGLTYPQYGWEKNVGYGTRKHLLALEEHGTTIHHRRSFSPIKKLIS